MKAARAETLRILIAADPDLPVPPDQYGGIERVIALLVDGLVARGHAVTLVANAASRTAARLVSYSTTSSRGVSVLASAATVMRAVKQASPDVIHSFARLAALAPVLMSPVPKVMSYQRAVTPRSVALGRSISRSTLTFVSCSRRLIQAEELRGLAPWRVVPNAVDTNRFTCSANVPANAPLVFLGRIEPIKGAHLAIAVARRSGRPLVIAGNVPAGHQAYFDQAIAPHVDGRAVRYAGPVDDHAKLQLLSEASALLMPVLWEEPFGIVMAEALACGTPVIALNRGAVPEVVDDGVTGFVCADEEAMVRAIPEVTRLSREACRRSAEARFSQLALVEAYEAVYRECLADQSRVSTPARHAALQTRQD